MRVNIRNMRNMRKWVSALRSGKYKQGQCALRYRGRFCVLGVACDVSGLGEWRGRDFDLDEYAVRDGDASPVVMPLEVADWYGVASSPAVKTTRGCEFLTTLNDAFGLTFSELADAIERTWPEVRTKKRSRA
jgi:hypothetical protein